MCCPLLDPRACAYRGACLGGLPQGKSSAPPAAKAVAPDRSAFWRAACRDGAQGESQLRVLLPAHVPGNPRTPNSMLRRCMVVRPDWLARVQGFCPCGEQCSNQQFSRRQYARLEKVRARMQTDGVHVRVCCCLWVWWPICLPILCRRVFKYFRRCVPAGYW